MKSKVTLTDVAEAAGMSVGTASMALSGHPAVAEKTRREIRQIASRLNYRRCILGRSLASRKSFLISLISRSHLQHFVPNIIAGINDAIRGRDYSLVAYHCGDTTADERKHLELSLDRQVDGIIVIPAIDQDGHTNASSFSPIARQGVPVVQIILKALPGIPGVYENGMLAGEMLTKHLISLGHKRILHVTHEYCVSPVSIPCANERWQGYKQAMEQASLEPQVLTHADFATEGPERYSYSSTVENVADDVLNHPSRPTALVGYCDHQIAILLRVLTKRGVKVPQRFSITGFDDLPHARFTNPTLTTVNWQMDEIGRQAANKLFDLMDGEQVAADTLIEPKLVVRESTVAI